jgi:hypothetical protein
MSLDFPCTLWSIFFICSSLAGQLRTQSVKKCDDRPGTGQAPFGLESTNVERNQKLYFKYQSGQSSTTCRENFSGRRFLIIGKPSEQSSRRNVRRLRFIPLMSERRMPDDCDLLSLLCERSSLASERPRLRYPAWHFQCFNESIASIGVEDVMAFKWTGIFHRHRGPTARHIG